MAEKLGPDSTSQQKVFWAIETLMDLTEEDPEMAWEIILAILEEDSSEKILGNVAAGPLEDLMCVYGEEIMDRIESQAQRDPVFKKCMAGVWLDSRDTLVWRRFYEIAGIEPPLPDKPHNKSPQPTQKPRG